MAEMLAAISRQNVALNPSVQGTRISAKKMIQERDETKDTLQRAEFSYNRHVVACDLCKAENKEQWHLSELKE